MGNLCACNYNINNEGKGEFFGFKNVNKINEENKEYWIVKKVKFRNTEPKDNKYYGKTNEYDELMKSTFPQEKTENDDVKDLKEYTNGTVRVIRY